MSTTPEWIALSDDQIIMGHIRNAHDLMMAVEMPTAATTEGTQ